ncbi:hypothetical protein ACJMK2_018659 [Sinanodonta woodiana]|uniref:Uncharacterized protein n=1 Tax=Sinanodonta woodiana TaxID=1069815 RepID=A0ABD3UHH3_SINWO
MTSGVSVRFIGSLFVCFVLSVPEFSAQTQDEVLIPVTAKSIFGPIIHRDMMEAYYVKDRRYIRIYMAIYDDKGGYPKHKDIWQDSEGHIVIYPSNDRLWVGFGTPRRQLEFAYKYRNQVKAENNSPLLRSLLVDSKVVISIVENAVPEQFSANAFDINVDQAKNPNQFGLRQQSTELLRQNALSGSLVTYYMDEASLVNTNTEAWGQVKSIKDLTEILAYPDPDPFVKKNKIIVPSWLSQAEINNVISETWDTKLYSDFDLRYFRQKALPYTQESGLEESDIIEREGKSENHKIRLQARNKLVVLFEEVRSFMTKEKHTNLGKLIQGITEIQTSEKWTEFAVGKDVSTERFEFMKEAYNHMDDLTVEQETRIGNQLDHFIKSFEQGSEYHERIVFGVGRNKPDLTKYKGSHQTYYFESLNDNLPFAYTVPKTAAIYFVESASETSFSTSHLTPNDISKFVKRNFIGKEIDEIHVESPSWSTNEEKNVFLSTLATQLRQTGKGYEERMVEANKCYAKQAKKETTIYIPELHYLWSKDRQGTLMLFDKGKYQVHSNTIDNVEDLFPKLSEEIKNRLNVLKLKQFSGGEIIETLLTTKYRNIIAAVEHKARTLALKKESKRKSEEAKDSSLKDAAKDEMYRLVGETLCGLSSRRKRSLCDVGQIDFDVIDESVEITDHDIKFQISPFSKALGKRQNSVMSKIHLGLGVHGAFANFFGALHYFQTGDNARGGFSLFQSLHSVGQLTGLNEKIAYKLADSAAGRIVNKYLQQSSLKIASSLFKANKMVEKAASNIDRLIGSVPIVGMAFNIYFLEEDIANIVHNQDIDLVPLYAIDLALDSVTTLLSFDPVLEPVVMALSIVRMVFDDGALQHLLAVIIGVIDGLGDANTLGFLRQKRELKLQEQTNMEFLKNLSTVENYFQVSTEDNDFLQLDLNAGEDYMYGGFLTVRLFDNDTFEIEVDAVPTISGLTAIKKSSNGKIRDVILGIGQSTHLANYGMTSAKLLIFPVKYYHTFEFKPTPFPTFGQYFGKKYNNTFVAIRGNHSRTQDHQCDDIVYLRNASLNLDNISYFISGKDGNDVFLLGPEQFRIDGGRGQDSYFIPWYGGYTVILNFADDISLDSLFMNVSYDAVQCVRYNDDLLIHYCGKRTVTVQHWFASTARTYHQHLRIITNDGVTIEPVEDDADEDGIEFYPIEIDLSHTTESNNIDLSLPNFQHVTTVVGSNFTDVITGNDKGNVLIGGLGADTLKGGKGEDVYVISAGEGCDVINITSNVKFTKRITFNTITIVDSTDRLKTCFSIIDENTFINQPPVSLITIDNIIFEIKYNEDSELVEKVPVILDFSKSTENVSIDLLAPENGNIKMSERDAARVVTISDSKHSDHIIANNQDNFLSCSGGDPDHLEGRGGQDLYFLLSQIINHFIWSFFPHNSLVIRSIETGLTIVMLNWFINSTYQHLVVETVDAKFMKNMNLLPVEMRFMEQSCKDKLHTINLSEKPLKNVHKVVARPKSCIVSVIGNELGNHIDLGPTSVAERRHMEGQNGSDTYVVDYGYGAFNEINNFAMDEKDDHILLGILYDDIKIGVVGNDLIIISSSHREHVTVRIIDFLLGARYQHLIATTSDGITMKLEPLFPYKTVLIVDKSYSSYPVVVDKTYPELMAARKIKGLMLEGNYIEGGDDTLYIAGGNTLDGLGGSDIIYGRDENDVLTGGPGDDRLYGGKGHDTIYGGNGGDSIDGGSGINTIVFKGDGFNHIGVFVNLLTGNGSDADADGDTYTDIQNISGSEYNDILHRNDEDNVINGFQGNDYISSISESDIYNCSDATGRKEIWLDGNFNLPDLIVLGEIQMNNICYFFIENDLFITDTSLSAADKLLCACALDDEIRRFKRCSWMFVLDFSETEIIILLNGSYIVESFENGISLRFSLSYSDASMVRVTELITTSYNGSYLVVLGKLLPGVEYTITLSLLKCHIELESYSITQYTLPIKPVNVKALNIFSYGFDITWTLATIFTNNYYIEGFVKSTNKTFTFLASVDNPYMAMKSLSPHTYYEVRVRSVVSTYTSSYTDSLFVRTNANCGNVTAPNDGFINGTELTDNGYVTTLACNEGFKLLGDKTVVCDSPNDVGNQICSQKKCHIPAMFKSFAKITWFQTAPWSVLEVTWTCINGFEIDPWETTNTLICERGQWTFSNFLICMKSVRCPYPVALENEDIHRPKSMSTEFKRNVTLRVSCNRGFSLVGPTKISCLGSSWTELPTCIPLSYPLPPHINHGNYQNIAGSKKAMLRCDESYIPEEWNTSIILDYLKGNTVPNEYISCEDGNWMSKIQNCVPIAEYVGKVNYLFYVRGVVELKQNISWVDLDSVMTSSLLNNICKRLGLSYGDFSSYVLICNRLIRLNATILYDGVPNMYVDDAWHNICFSIYDYKEAKEFCHHLSHSGFTVKIYNGDEYRAKYQVLRKTEYYDPIVQEMDQSCNAYIRCRNKCSNPNIQNDCSAHIEQQEWWFQGEQYFVCCMPGYVRLGSELITCGSDGKWSEHPICEPKVIETKETYEGWDATFSCGKGQFVDILSANYHADCNLNLLSIPFFKYPILELFHSRGTACTINDVTVRAVLYCQDKRVCALPATNEIHSDPCPHVTKKLVVTATCVN